MVGMAILDGAGVGPVVGSAEVVGTEITGAEVASPLLLATDVDSGSVEVVGMAEDEAWTGTTVAVETTTGVEDEEDVATASTLETLTALELATGATELELATAELETGATTAAPSTPAQAKLILLVNVPLSLGALKSQVWLT